MRNKHEWLVCPRCRSALERLDPVLKRAVFAENLQLRVLSLYLIAEGGKRLRPSLLFLGATYGKWDEKRLLIAAAALEMIHVASLYHDDVMDRATLRRNVPSVNARWGNSMAALAGNYLVAKAMTMLSHLGPVTNQLASEAATALATGQLMEVENAYNLELTEQEHLEILRRKTATLFELPLQLGAVLSGASPQHTAALCAYGRHLGLAFQLVDDALDLTSSPETLGKAIGIDLREGVYSLAVLKGLRNASGPGERLQAILGQVALSEADSRVVRQLLQDSGSIESALQCAKDYVRQAHLEVDQLPGDLTRDSLHRLADFTLQRRS